VKGWKKYILRETSAMLISDKIDAECHYIMIKGSTHQEDTTIANIHPTPEYLNI
jgi:hypothetical protein